jgi:hypothetical protein
MIRADNIKYNAIGRGDNVFHESLDEIPMGEYYWDGIDWTDDGKIVFMVSYKRTEVGFYPLGDPCYTFVGKYLFVWK